MFFSKTTKFVSVVLVLIICFGNTALAANQSDSIMSDQYPVYTKGYDENYVSNTHGWAVRGYQTGTLFDWWCCRSYTEVWCDSDYAVSAYQAYAYAKVENKNKTNELQYDSSTIIDSTTRVCSAYTDRIDAKYASHLGHESKLTVNNSVQWSLAQGGKYYLP